MSGGSTQQPQPPKIVVKVAPKVRMLDAQRSKERRDRIKHDPNAYDLDRKKNAQRMRENRKKQRTEEEKEKEREKNRARQKRHREKKSSSKRYSIGLNNSNERKHEGASRKQLNTYTESPLAAYSGSQAAAGAPCHAGSDQPPGDKIIKEFLARQSHMENLITVMSANFEKLFERLDHQEEEIQSMTAPNTSESGNLTSVLIGVKEASNKTVTLQQMLCEKMETFEDKFNKFTTDSEEKMAELHRKLSLFTDSVQDQLPDVTEISRMLEDPDPNAISVDDTQMLTDQVTAGSKHDDILAKQREMDKKLNEIVTMLSVQDCCNQYGTTELQDYARGYSEYTTSEDITNEDTETENETTIDEIFTDGREYQVSLRGGADLHEVKKRCQKYPKHSELLIPFKDFNFMKFPYSYMNTDMEQLIQSLSALTVLVKVTKVSPARHVIALNPGLDLEDPQCSIYGSGWVWYIFKKSNEKCPCQECIYSSSPHTQWAELEINTSRDVIFDETEAANATCYFDYNSDDTDLDLVPRLSHMTYVANTDHEGTCAIRACTHDMNLVQKLDQHALRYRNLQEKVREKYHEDSSLPEQNLTLIVSHPHGLGKCVSVGNTKYRKEKDGMTVYTYTTPTCSGSSGAPVFILGKQGSKCDHSHSRSLSLSKLNQSAAWYD